MKKESVLVTGGAGFIGSNLVEALLKDERVGLVRVLDNFSTGFKRNIEDFLDNPHFELIEGDITDFDVCMTSMVGIDLISHQAALGSIPRSVEDPITTNRVNIEGSLNILHAAVKSKVKRVIYAASSSTFGDSKALPKVEGAEGKPLSPYAVTKLVNELYADVFNKVYGLETIGLRYFNVFGPKQNPKGAYAAVIPIFVDRALKGDDITIFGDGETSRDFTYVSNAVSANLLGLFSDHAEAINEVYNVACGERMTLNELTDLIFTEVGQKTEVIYKEERVGDIKHSHASIDKISNRLSYKPIVKTSEGIKKAVEWYRDNIV